MGVKHFGGVTHWDTWDPKKGTEGWSQPGWALPGDSSRYIGKSDPYWDRVLNEARQTYGDPAIRYSTDSVGAGRHLVFGDGTALPADGTVVYHDAASRQSWAQNDDGTVSLIGADGRPGSPLRPAGYRRIGERYAPVDDHGQQVAPQRAGVPDSDNGFHTDPVTGILTPKNANGDYYTLGPDGERSYFDKTGAPISQAQFNTGSAPPSSPPPPPTPLSTDEQQSGKAADAVKKLQQELKNHYSRIWEAEEKLSEVLLNAHATTVAGQRQLNDIQQRIVEAVTNPAMAVDTAAGERAFLTFLRNQVSAIDDLLTSGALAAEDQGKATQALAALYAADSAARDDASALGPPGLGAVPEPAPPQAAPAAPAVASDADPGVGDLGPSPMVAAADPGMSDLLGGAPPLGMPPGGDPLSSLAALPSALGGLGGGGASPLDGLSGLLGAASPLAGLAFAPVDHPGHEHGGDTTDTADAAPKDGKDTKDGKADPAASDTTGGAPSGQQPVSADQNGTGSPPPAAGPPTGPSSTVALPDGSTATARNPQAAQAIRDYLAGDTVEASYRKNGLALPPLGTPITHPVDPSRLACGDVAVFKDHYVPVLSAVKAYLNGQVVPLGSVSSSPDFLGWMNPTAVATVPTTATGAPAPPAAAAPAPAPPVDLPAPLSGG